MKNAIVLGMLIAATLCQQKPYPPVLVANDLLKPVLLESGKEACDQDKVKNIVDDIFDNGYFVYVLNSRRLNPKDFPTDYSTPTVNQAIKEAVAAPGTVITKKDNSKEWDNSSPLKYSQSLVFAVAKSESSVDYYHFEFHLNMQGRMIGSQADYIKAHQYWSCIEKNDWIQKYFA
jgi:hypothetical protein